ncbi:nucleic acid-binding, OB-fold protein [Tanacetum coccineum]
MSEATIASLKVGQEKCVLEAKVYQKWNSKSIPQMTQLAFWCILIDRENNAVQANMDLNNLDYFDSLLKPRTTYRILNFICEKKKPYQQTLENKISLRFGKTTTFEVLTGKEFEFAEHHFKFTTYNQLQSKVPYRDEDSKLIYPILTGSKKNTNSTHLFKCANTVMLTQNTRRHGTDRHYTPCQCNKASTETDGAYTCEDHGKQDPPTYRYNFKATVTDGTATAEFTFFTEAGQKITGHPCSHLMEKFEATDKTQLPIEMVNTIGKKHIFQIQFTPSTQKGAGRFIVNDVLDIKSAGLMINESTSKDKGVDTESSTSTALTTKDSTNEDKSIPGPYF